MQGKHLIFVALLAALLGIFGGYEGAKLRNPEAQAIQTQHESAYERVMRTRTIRCGYFVWPPLLVKDPNTGALSGFYHDFMATLGEALDLKIEWVQELNFSTYIQDLANGRYDMECTGGWPNAQRGKLAYYAKPYAFIPSVVIVRADDTRFDQNQDLINSPSITVATIDGEASSVVRTNRFPLTKNAGLPSNTPFSDLILSVVTHKADVTFLDPVGSQQYVENNPGKIKILNYPHPVYLIALTVTLPQDDRLKQTIDVAIDQMQNSGQTEALLRKYETKGPLFFRVDESYRH